MDKETKGIIIGFVTGVTSGIVTLYIFYNYIAKSIVQQSAERAAEEAIIKYRSAVHQSEDVTRYDDIEHGEDVTRYDDIEHGEDVS